MKLRRMNARTTGEPLRRSRLSNGSMHFHGHSIFADAENRIAGLKILKTSCLPREENQAISNQIKPQDFAPAAKYKKNSLRRSRKTIDSKNFCQSIAPRFSKSLRLFALWCASLVFLSLPLPGAPADLDPAFGGTGRVLSPAAGVESAAAGVAVQPDGRIIAAGCFAGISGDRFGLIRYNEDGSLDASFGDFGRVETGFGISDRGRCVAVQDDGRIIVAGNTNTGTPDFALARYLPNGSLDPAFNGAGKVVTDIRDHTDDDVRAMVLQKDGKILVSGNSVTAGALSLITVVRYNADGTLDTAFRGTGILTIPMGFTTLTDGAAVQDDGKIILTAQDFDGGDHRIVLIRLNADGTFDTDFAGSGIALTDFGFDAQVSGLALQSDGRIIISGSARPNETDDFLVARFLADGSLDKSFNGTGRAITPVGDNEDASTGVVIQKNGKIVAAGRSRSGTEDRFAIVRYLADGSLDKSFNGNGKLITSAGLEDKGPRAVALQSDGKIVLAGASHAAPDDGGSFALVRCMGDFTAGPPAVVTGSVSGIGDTSATLHGAVNARGAGAEVFFDYGLTSAYGSTVSAGLLPAGTAPVPVSAAITGLTPRSIYHYRVRASNPEGTVTASDSSFFASSSPVMVIEQPAGTPLSSEDSRSFGSVQTGNKAYMSFKLRNAGDADLSGIVPVISGQHAAEFTIAAFSAHTIQPGAAAGLTVRFTPQGEGMRTALLRIPGSEAGVNSFVIALQGAGTIPSSPAGTLDTSFNFMVSTDSLARSMAVEPDGNILIGGSFNFVNGWPLRHIARLNGDGRVNDLAAFDPNTALSSFALHCLAGLPDRKILTGGYFKLARRNANGSLDTGFNPGATTQSGGTSFVDCMALQPDGKILVGGRFQTMDGQARNGIARFHPDGTVESTDTFNAGSGTFAVNSDWIRSIAVQPDGKIVIGGGFTSVNGQPRERIARLNADGSVESLATFKVDAGGANGLVNCLALQPDGKILLGGDFNRVNGRSRRGIARLNSHGSLDATFTTIAFNFPSSVQTIALQANGKILIGGSFTTVNNQPRVGVARLNRDGSLESTATFDPGTGPATSFGDPAAVSSLAVQADGKILIAGTFATFGGEPSGNLARLNNQPATQTLTAVGKSRVQWARGGSAPEVEFVTFELATEPGAPSTLLGIGSRIPGGWELTGLSLPESGLLRALGRTRSGFQNGGSGLVGSEASLAPVASEITVWLPSFDTISSGARRNFGVVPPGESADMTLSIINGGEISLTELTVTIEGPDADLFTLASPPASSVKAFDSTTFTIRFSSSSAGEKSAALHITGFEAKGSPFDILLTGGVPTASQAWRQQFFGTFADTGPAADLSDPDNDGIANLVEFATGSHPLTPNSPPGAFVHDGEFVTFTFPKLKAAGSELYWSIDWSDDISRGWVFSGGGDIVSDDGTIQMVKITFPASSSGKRFARLRVTRK